MPFYFYLFTFTGQSLDSHAFECLAAPNLYASKLHPGCSQQLCQISVTICLSQCFSPGPAKVSSCSWIYPGVAQCAFIWQH
jgi:hypothetical protein